MIKINSIEKKFLLILGFVSTFQLLTISNVTLFSILLIFLSICTFLFNKKFYLPEKLVLIFMFSITISEIFFILSNYSNIWLKKSILSYVLLWCLFLVFIYISSRPLEVLKYFIKGVYFSSIFQVFWSLVQVVLYYLLKINLNQLIFENFLHLNGDFYQIKNGILRISGLNSNPGILVPSLLVVLCFSNNTYIKVIVTFLTFFLGSTTPILAVIFFWVLVLIEKFIVAKKKKLFQIIKYLFYLLALILVMFFLTKTTLWDAIYNQFNTANERVSSVLNNNFTDSSTFTHFRYYSSIPIVLKNSGFIKSLFGYGWSASGIPFVNLFNQYSDTAWVPESDFVNILWSCGLLGLLIFYSILFKAIGIGSRVDSKYVLIFVSFIFAGLFYGLQLNWVMLLEFVLLETADRKFKIKDLLT